MLLLYVTNIVFLRFCINMHTCHKLCTEICEINKNFKGGMIKFCEIFTKINLELLQITKKLLFQCKKLVINTIKCDL